MWAIIEGTIDYTTSDVMDMYAVIAAVAFGIAIFMFKTACNKDD